MIEGAAEIDLGGATLRPRARAVSGPAGAVAVEPLVMQFLLALVRKAGELVTRTELFQTCWGDVPVGDDSLNRVTAAARKALRQVAPNAPTIETVPARGYVLRLPAIEKGQNKDAAVESACRGAFASWRMAMPEPDHLALERLRRATAFAPDNDRGWGMLALMLRHAAEYASPQDRAMLVSECERAAAQALAIDALQVEARVALTGIVPLFGNWLEARDRLEEILADHPGHPIAGHDLSIIEMSTGGIRSARSLVEPLLRDDPLAACFAYKTIYHHWSLGDLETMDRRADRAIQLWPNHPAVWTARFWSLAHTGRCAAASAMIAPDVPRPCVSESNARYLRRLMDAAGRRAGGREREDLAAEAVDAVVAGPAQAIASLMALGLLGDQDRAMAVAEAYYCHDGPSPVPNNPASELPVNEMRRRLTQIIFTPAGAVLRSHPRFDALCERIGLEQFWRESAREPDFRTA